MLKNLYKLFIAPTQADEDTRNRELVLNVLLSSTLLVLFLFLPILTYNYFALGKDVAPERMLWALGILTLVSGLYSLSRAGRYRIAASLLVALYFMLAWLVVGAWGVTTPVGILLFGVVIVLGGILLGSKYSLITAAAVITLLVVMHILTTQGVVQPDLSWTVDKPEIGDVIAFSLIFCFLAVVSWLFNFQMERSLVRAKRAEAALTRQKLSLEDTVTERTRQLQTEQLERIQQMYRFAELGQLSTALLHELANHLTTITMDIEGLDGDKSNVLKRAKRSIKYIDDMVHRVRDQLHGKSQTQTFNAGHEIDNVINILQHKAASERVTLLWQGTGEKKDWRTRGDSLRFRQLMANLVSNAIESYSDVDASQERRVVEVLLASRGKHLIITVNDWGKGVAEADRTKLFEAFYSTKKTGMGMGLYIAKQITEQHLQGQLKIDESKPYTSFVIKLNRAGA